MILSGFGAFDRFNAKTQRRKHAEKASREFTPILPQIIPGEVRV
jgi:hypothetical protein